MEKLRGRHTSEARCAASLKSLKVQAKGYTGHGVLTVSYWPDISVANRKTPNFTRTYRQQTVKNLLQFSR
jgi:hypothetical protein